MCEQDKRNFRRKKRKRLRILNVIIPLALYHPTINQELNVSAVIRKMGAGPCYMSVSTTKKSNSHSVLISMGRLRRLAICQAFYKFISIGRKQHGYLKLCPSVLASWLIGAIKQCRFSILRLSVAVVVGSVAAHVTVPHRAGPPRRVPARSGSALLDCLDPTALWKRRASPEGTSGLRSLFRNALHHRAATTRAGWLWYRCSGLC